MKNYVLPAFIAFFSVAVSAQAGVLIEPFAGYGSGESTLTISGSGTTPSLDSTRKAKGNGAVYGGRLGYGFGPLIIGGEYQAASVKSSSDDTKPTEAGAFLGVRVPFITALAGYTVSNKAVDLVGNGGYKVLLGLRFLPVVQINLEYVVRKYKDVSPRPAGVSSGATFTTENKTYQLTLSLPIEI